MNIIYENLETAKQSLEKYFESVKVLQEQFGVSEDFVDSCFIVSFNVKYRDKTGKVQNFDHLG
jgi:hypothetical protein